MDPLSIAAAAAGIAGFAFTLSKFISESYEGSQSLDTKLQQCGIEVGLLSQILGELEVKLKDPNFKKIYGAIVIGDGHDKHLASLGHIISECESSLKRLESILVKVSDGGRLAQGVVRKWKLKFRSSEMAVIRSQIQNYQKALGLGLHMVSLLLSADLRNSIGNLDTSVEEGFSKLDDELRDLRMCLRNRSFADIDQNSPQDLHLLEEDKTKSDSLNDYINATESFAASASEYIGSQSGSRAGNMSVGALEPLSRRRIQRWARPSVVPEGSSSEDSDDNDFENSRIAGLKALGEKRLSEKDHARAESCFLQFLKRTENLNWPELDTLEVKLGLVVAYKAQEKYGDARKVLEPCLTVRGISKVQKLSMTHNLAEICYLSEDYIISRFYAEKAAKGRRRMLGSRNDQFFESVGLLAKVLYKMDEPADAEYFQTLLPPGHSSLQELIGSHETAVTNDADQSSKNMSQEETKAMATLEKIKNSVFLLHAISTGAADVCAVLLSRGADPNSVNLTGSTALQDAIKRKNSAIVDSLIQKGADIGLQSGEYDKLVRAAVSQEDATTTAILLQAGADFENKSQLYGDLLFLTIPHESDDMTKLLIEAGADVNAKHSDGLSILHVTIQGGKSNNSKINLLLSSGALPNVATESENSVLHTLFISNKGDLETLRILLEAESNVNSTNVKGESALHIAARHGITNVSQIKLLLASKPRLDLLTEDGKSALHELVRSSEGDLETLKLLLEAGADPEVRDRRGYTTLLAAVETAECDQSIVKCLIETGSDLNATDNQNNSVLLLATKSGRDEIVKMLIVEGAKVTFASPTAPLLLHAAIKSGNKQSILYLLRAGANVEAQDSRGWRPIHAAVDELSGAKPIWEPQLPFRPEEEDISMLSILLDDAKADIKARDKDNYTVLHHAILRNRSKTVEYLLKYPWIASQVKRQQPRSTASFASQDKNIDFSYIIFQGKLYDEETGSIVRQLLLAGLFIPQSVYSGYKDSLKDLGSRYPELKTIIANILATH